MLAAKLPGNGSTAGSCACTRSGSGTQPPAAQCDLLRPLHSRPRRQAGLIAVGEPTSGQGLDKALTGAAKVVKRGVKATIGEITSELQEALKEADMVDMHLEVDIIPVSDVDRSKQFYQSPGA